MTRLVLARHATCASTEQVLLGRTVDAPLDERGEAQALALAARLAAETPVVVVSSPRQRTHQTAEAIALASHCPLRQNVVLDELDFGRWDGQAFATLEADPDWREWNARRERAATPAGDTIAAVQQRVLPYLAALGREFPGHTAVVVSHAEVIRAVLMALHAVSARNWASIHVAPASWTRVGTDDVKRAAAALAGGAP